MRYFVRFSKETDSDDRSSIRAQGATFVTYCHTPLSLLEVQLRLLKLSLGAVLDVFKFAYRQENRLLMLHKNYCLVLCKCAKVLRHIEFLYKFCI